MMKPHAVIIHPEGNINNNPNLTGIVELLVQDGWKVDVYSPRRPHFNQQAPSEGARLILVDHPEKDGCFLFPGIDDAIFEHHIRSLFSGVSLLVGVDRGIIEASIIAQVIGVPYGLISYEIFFEKETSQLFKRIEINACRNIAFAIVQDQVRGKELARENRISDGLIFYVPVAGCNAYSYKNPRPRIFHQLLGLPAESLIALYIGSVSNWTMCGSLLKSVSIWPENWHLVIHNRYRLGHEIKGWMQSFSNAHSRIHVSTEPFELISQMRDFIFSADLGVSFYKPTYENMYVGKNLEYIGMASGKIATYLQHGIPVAVNQIGEMSDCVRKNNIGQVVDIPDVFIPDNSVLEAGPRCHDFFREHLDLTKTLRPWLKYVSSLVRKAIGRCGPYPSANNPFPGVRTEVQLERSYWVSAIVSTYNAERFIEGCLQDLVDQTLFKKGMLEIVIVNSGSQQREAAIVAGFRDKYSEHVVYLETEERESIYQAWNRGIRVASGKYITNANTDDRHRQDALEVMAKRLDANPGVALVYADVFVTHFENQRFDAHIRTTYHLRPEYEKEMMLSGCHMGPQPMWRKRLHDELGYFEEHLRSASDYEFWCRIAVNHPLMHIPEFLGLYYENPRGFYNTDRQLSCDETRLIRRRYADSLPPARRNYTNNYQYTGPVVSGEYVNICMVTCNRLEYNKQAIAGLVRNTCFPHVITVVDNNSQDGTREYLTLLHRSGVIKNLALLDEDIGVDKASHLAWHMEPDAAHYLKFDTLPQLALAATG